MSFRTIALTALLAAARLTSAVGAGKQQPATNPILGTDTVHGCYNSIGELKLNMSAQYNSQGKCAEACRNANFNVGATQSRDCYCGDKYPPKVSLTDDNDCTEPCPGFGDQACGGLNTFTVYNSGLKVSVADSDASVISSSSSAGSKPTSTDPAGTATGTAVVTPTGSSNKSSGGSSNTVGIAVGVVVGVLVVAGVGGGLFFFMRRRRNHEIEEEHRRNAAVNAFISGGKPPSSSGGISISDQRLDPVMVQRRESSGSIADNQDYSRRILRVTNA